MTGRVYAPTQQLSYSYHKFTHSHPLIYPTHISEHHYITATTTIRRGAPSVASHTHRVDNRCFTHACAAYPSFTAATTFPPPRRPFPHPGGAFGSSIFQPHAPCTWVCLCVCVWRRPRAMPCANMRACACLIKRTECELYTRWGPKCLYVVCECSI